jgi:hypothetical protein
MSTEKNKLETSYVWSSSEVASVCCQNQARLLATMVVVTASIVDGGGQ